MTAEPVATPDITPVVLLIVHFVTSLLLHVPVPGLALLNSLVLPTHTFGPPVIGNKAGGVTKLKVKNP